MYSLGINVEGRSSEQPTNPRSPVKMATVSVCLDISLQNCQSN